jgi:uncharacterized protein
MSDPSLLTPVEARVLGCLIEKEITTPDYYPMTLNSLVAACNQRSNRDPVTEWDEATVEAGLDGLRRHRLTVMIHMAGSRVPKYKHALDAAYGSLDEAMVAVLCELLVRNFQTPGELRTRTERLQAVQDLPGLEATVQRLVDYGTGPLAVVLPPGGGRRVRTVAHLLCGPVDEASPASANVSAAATVIPPPADWKADMEAEIASLKQEVASLRETVDQLKVLLD